MDTLFDEADAGGPPTLTVGELSARIQQLTAQAFPADLWVSGQIRNLSRSAAGHVYFNLTEPTEHGATPRTQLPITLLEPERQHVNRQLLRAGGAVRMEDGIDVRICGRLRWYAPRGVLQFKMHGIDPAFTLGRLQADRERLLRRLADEGLVDANASLPLPVVPLRVGLVTSRGSAAEADARHELEASGFAFDVRFVDARTQGVECGPSVTRALARLARMAEVGDLDVVLLVRGGGARTDLAGFDGEDIARAIAAMPVPVLTGIGHEIDRSVADDLAHTAHKTPTAAAAALVAQVRDFLGRLDVAWSRSRRAALAATSVAAGRLDERTTRIARAGVRTLARHDARLDDRSRRVARGASRTLTRADDRLQAAADRVGPRAMRSLDRAADRVALLDARAMVHDPALALARGWSITTTADGRAVRDLASIAVGTDLQTRVAGGTIRSTVVATTPDAPNDPDRPDRPDPTSEVDQP